MDFFSFQIFSVIISRQSDLPAPTLSPRSRAILFPPSSFPFSHPVSDTRPVHKLPNPLKRLPDQRMNLTQSDLRAFTVSET